MVESKEYIITREFNAPPELVFKVWTDPKHFNRWYGPKGTVITRAELDVRKGGVSYVSMKAPNGTELSVKWTYQEVVPPHRLVWSGYCIDATGDITRHPFHPMWPLKIMTEVVFEEKGNLTQVTFKWIPLDPKPEEMEAFLKSFDGATAGWGSSFEKLDTYLVELQDTTIQ